MHDPIDSADTSKDASELNDQQDEKKEKEESSATKTERKLNGGSELMGLQTQQHLLNGGNDVIMADAEGGASSDHSSDGDAKSQQSAPPNGEGNKAKEEVVDGANGQGQGQQAGDSKESKAKPPAPDSNGTSKASDSAPPPPVLRGTLSYNTDLRRHLIRGMWNYENSNAFPPQRFELLRNLDPGEDPTILPKDGEFHGSFSLAYFHTTSKGKQKERSKVIPESGVYIKFTPVVGEEGNFKVDGKGTNQFGIFHINGHASPSTHVVDNVLDPGYDIVLRKRYEPSAPTVAATADPTPVEGGKKMKKRKLDESEDGDASARAAEDAGPLPAPCQSYEKNVVCLRGKLYKEESEDLGVGEVVHRINGMWSSGLDFIIADPQNAKGLCNRFEYEHKSSVPSQAFPISGRYSGWFDLSQEDGTRARINERDITLRFRKNDAGFHNIEGRGSNVFGKYSITGTFTQDNVITIFRHFQPRKIKASKPVTSAPPPINAPGQARKPPVPAVPEPQIKMEEVIIPESEELLEPLKAPEHPTYSAVSRGILRLNEDGSHSCQGKWAVTREHFTNGQTSNFNFRLEAHFVTEAAKNVDDRPFPLDSEMYKGSFQLKKGGARYSTVVDQQIVMKFRKNSAGSYNVYGKGINGIGVFNLTGTLIMSGKTGGQVEVYRMYPPELLAATPAPAKAPAPVAAVPKTPTLPRPPRAPAPAPLPVDSPPITPNIVPSSSTMLPGPPRAGITRRESTRLVKVPSRLEDDDPTAQLNRIMEKCHQILRFMREKDVERGAFFSEPVDPVALGIPTYHTIVSEPMDLRTLHRKMEAEEVETPEDFARLSRLVFENAMTFNVDPTHSVHQAARNLLILFNQKFRDVERLVTNIRRQEREGGKKGKDDKKRKRDDEPKSLKRMRLEEAQDMADINARSMEAIVAAASSSTSTTVSRNEFTLMLQMMQQLQQQVVQTYTAVAELSSDDLESGSAAMPLDLASMDGAQSSDMISLSSVPEKKPPKKKIEEPKIIEKPVVVEDDSKPLTLAEQELLTDTINELHADHLHGVIHIIREAAKLTGEEDEIDLEIDQLDTATQRQLLRHVSKVSYFEFHGSRKEIFDIHAVTNLSNLVYYKVH
jgi:hypothetical protein